MRKLTLLVALFASATLFTQCKQAPANQYTVAGTAEGTPELAILTYQVDGQTVTDSATVEKNAFKLIGVADEPTAAKLIVQYTAPEGELPKRFENTLYLEPGVIAVNIPEDMTLATIAGTKTNDDAAAWKAIEKPFEEQMRQIDSEYSKLTPEEQAAQFPALSERAQALREQGTAARKEFVAAHPDSWFAMRSFLLSTISANDVDAAQAEFDKFTPEVKATKAGQNIQETINKWKAVAIGQVAPDFTQNDVDGNPVKLSDFRGKWVLIDFWASWCSPCRAENPNVVATYNQFKDKNFTILGVSLDRGKDEWVAAIAADKLDWTQVSDLKFWENEVAQLYAINSIPANFLLNPEGVIVARNLRGDQLAEELAKNIQ